MYFSSSIFGVGLDGSEIDLTRDVGYLGFNNDLHDNWHTKRLMGNMRQ